MHDLFNFRHPVQLLYNSFGDNSFLYLADKSFIRKVISAASEECTSIRALSWQLFKTVSYITVCSNRKGKGK